jgi:tRNA 2-selenouridine synthase
MRPQDHTANYREIFLGDRPMIDTRAPGEFSKGAFPSATNLPLMTDRERQQVGTAYKKTGRAAAIELGEKLVNGAIREERVEGWCAFARQHPEGVIYCYRGGLRSQTAQGWMHEAGVDYPFVAGGYKAMRQFLLRELDDLCNAMDTVLISGKTGSGKTRVIEALSRAVDLEGIAKHRGSTFGQLLDPQPSQVDFENSVIIALMKLMATEQRPVFLEDESRLIGRNFIPPTLQIVMRAAPIIVVEEPLERRVEVVVEDYILDLGRRFAERHGEFGPTRHRDKLLADLGKIHKRLGGARHAKTAALLNQAFEQQWLNGDLTQHREWIELLLLGYYDPMYEYQLDKRAGEVLFRGSREEAIAFARSLSTKSGPSPMQPG